MSLAIFFTGQFWLNVKMVFMNEKPDYDSPLGFLGQELLALFCSQDQVTTADIQDCIDEFNRTHEASIQREDVEFIVNRLRSLNAPSPLPIWLPEKYSYIKTLASGATASVFLAEDKSNQSQVAIKLINPGESLKRVQQETRILKELDSPYIVKLIDAYFDHNDPLHVRAAIVMQYIEGVYLDQIIKQNSSTPHPIEEATRWMYQAAMALRDAHNQRIIHRDVKPANLVVDTTNRSIKLLDFGLASNLARNTSLTQTGAFLGTPHYISPEQSRDPSNLDIRNDIYSYGATFYHLLTGTTPFKGDVFDLVNQHRNAILESPSARNPALPQLVTDIIETCMAKKARDRYDTFDDILTLLTPPERRAPERPVLESPAMMEASLDSAPMQWNADSLDDIRFSKMRMETGSPTAVKDLTYRGNRSIEISHGDLLRAGENCEVIVVCDDSQLSMGGGTARHVLNAAGQAYFEQTRHLAPVIPGRVVTSTTGNLSQRFIFHAITIPSTSADHAQITPTPDLIRSLLDSCFYHAESLGIHSIALPLLGTGFAGMDPNVCYETMIDHLARELDFGLTPIESVKLVVPEGVAF